MIIYLAIYVVDIVLLLLRIVLVPSSEESTKREQKKEREKATLPTSYQVDTATQNGRESEQ